MKSTSWICLSAMVLAMSAAACSNGDGSQGAKGCDPACGNGLICNEITGQCVDCLADLDCQSPKKYCRMFDHLCVECLANGDCLAGYQCNADTNVCEAQGQAPECGEDKPCAGAGEECVDGRCVEKVECTSENEKEVCPGSECTEDGLCLNSKEVSCWAAAAPAYATIIESRVTITWTAADGWSTPENCRWECDEGFELTDDGKACETTVVTECTEANEATACPGSECVDGKCLTSKKQSCRDEAPANAQSQVAQVTVVWTAAGGWSAPAVCDWACNEGFEKSSDGKACVSVSTTECTQENEATACPKNGECTQEGFCLRSKSAACTDAAPPNATSEDAMVTVSWTAEAGWQKAAACRWKCDDGYQMNAAQDGCVFSCKFGTCSGNLYCNEQNKEVNCGAQVCIQNQGCQDKLCTATSGCLATYQTCNTSANGGLGECVAASCSSSSCSGDYACVSGKWTECAHGCQSGACKAAAVGCAAAADPEEYCIQSSIDDNHSNGVCDISTGDCVECLADIDCGTNGLSECVNKTCRKICGNGTVDSGEECDPNAATSGWQNQGKCPGNQVGAPTCNNECKLNTSTCTSCGNGVLDEGEQCDPALATNQWAPYHRSCEEMSGGNQSGAVTCDSECLVDASDCSLCGNGRLDEGEDCDIALSIAQWKYTNCSEYDEDHTGSVSCEKITNAAGNKECSLNIDQCVAGPCAGITADEECTSFNNGPQPCDVFFPDGGVNAEAEIVCKAASASCTSKLVIDEAATEAACTPEEQPKVAVDWCRNQSNSGSYNLQLNGTTTNLDFYGQVNVSGVTGSSGTGSANIKGEFVYWNSEYKNMNSIAASKTSDSFDGSNVNDQWKANVSVSDFATDGDYFYSWRFTADNGASWYYCMNEKQNNGSGGTTSDAQDVQLEGNSIAVTKPSVTTITEDFSRMTNRATCTTTTNFSYTDTDSFVGNSSVSWEYKGFACALKYTGDENSHGVGIAQTTKAGNYLKASQIPSGVGVVTVKYRFNNVKNSGTLEIYVGGKTTASASAFIQGSQHDAATGLGTASLIVNEAASTMEIRPKHKNANDTFLISEVSWTSYP